MKGQQKAVRTAADAYLAAGVQALEGVRVQFVAYLTEKEAAVVARMADGGEKVVTGKRDGALDW